MNATQATSSASNHERAEAFTTCMRSRGVPDFPGVTISANAQIQLNGGSVNPISATYQAAAKACASPLPTGNALPTAPEPPAPDASTFTFTRDGDCPKPPKAPVPPS